jgi:AcrR family transcriptional regulator
MTVVMEQEERPMPDDVRRPRDRMVYSAAQLVRARGVTATGVRDVVEHAGAPRGSFQHYFPGGKDQLIGEAVRWAAGFAAQWVASYPQTTEAPTPAGLFAHMVGWWRDDLSERGYERGCPVMATAADLAGSDSAVNEQLRPALDEWARAVVDQLVRMGVSPERSAVLATLMISSLEGAIMWARVRRDVEPLETVVAELSPLLDSHVTPSHQRHRR